MRGGAQRINEAVVVNLDIEPVEKPDEVLWVDPIHKGWTASLGPQGALRPSPRGATRQLQGLHLQMNRLVELCDLATAPTLVKRLAARIARNLMGETG